MINSFLPSTGQKIIPGMLIALLLFPGISKTAKSQDSAPYRGPVVIVKMITPSYPQLAKQAGIQGRIAMGVSTGVDGRVLRIRKIANEVYGLSGASRVPLSPARANLFWDDIEKLLKNDWQLIPSEKRELASQNQEIWVEFVFTLREARTPQDTYSTPSIMIECETGVIISMLCVRPWPIAN